MQTILFIGTNPSTASYKEVAFHSSTRSSQILTEWTKNIVGCKMHINVLNKKTENNRPLKTSEIKTNLPQLADNLRCIAPDKIIALGKIAAQALTLLGVDFYEMPHPSGRNRKLNDKKYLEEMVKGLAEFCSTSPQK